MADVVLAGLVSSPQGAPVQPNPPQGTPAKYYGFDGSAADYSFSSAKASISTPSALMAR